ncbi:heterokaryon incompatibility protein-domain-containing protein [Phyllosticta capitalensis]
MDGLDGSHGTTQDSVPRTNATNATLCDACSQDLAIDDWFAGGDLGRSDVRSGAYSLDLWSPWPKKSVPMWWRTQLCKIRNCSQKWYLPIRDVRGQLFPVDRWPFNEIGSESPELSTDSLLPRCVTPPALPELSSPVLQKCRFCERLKELFRKEYGDCPWWSGSESALQFYLQYVWRKEQHIDGSMEEKETKEIQLAVIVNHPGLPRNVAHVHYFYVAAWPGKCRDWLNITKTPFDPNGPVSDLSIQFMRRCIDECVNNHASCREKTTKTPFVPTRLLEIADGDNFKVRLVQGCRVPFRDSAVHQVKYATLSYCWGDSMSLKTTDENKDAHEQTGIPVQHMPQAFQDAIHVVRRLGIRYLWIDALCIIQGNTADWEAESVQMCDIFANAHVTLGAAATSSCSESFLQRNDNAQLTLSFHSSLNPNISGEFAILLERDLGAYIRLPDSRWNKRGWVFQEQIISARQLIFYKSMLSFRYNKGVELQSGCQTDSALNLDKTTIDERGAKWSHIVRSYSSKELTYPQDRLSAISGVAKFIGNSLTEAGKPKTYLAGLWLDESYDDIAQQHFAEDLCWIHRNSNLSFNELLEVLQSEDKFSAPSWSWASRNETGIDSRFGYHSRGSIVFQIVRYDIRPAHSDPMVSVKFGSSITLRGKLRQTPVIPSHGTCTTHSNYWDVTTPEDHLTFYLDWRSKSWYWDFGTTTNALQEVSRGGLPSGWAFSLRQ